MDLIPPTSIAEGERAVSRPILRNGRVIFTTLIPITATCTPGGTGWLMELDQNTGGRLDHTPFDLSGDDIVDNSDLVTVTIDGVEVQIAVSGIKSKVGIIKTPAIIECEDDLDCKYLSGSSGTIMEVKESIPGPPPGPGGIRRSWIQLR